MKIKEEVKGSVTENEEEEGTREMRRLISESRDVRKSQDKEMVCEQQKYHYGDLVRINKKLDACMSHFESDCDAIVITSYSEKYGGDNIKDYTLFLKGHGEVSWYYEWNFKLVKKRQSKLLESWKKEIILDIQEKSNLDWIFNNSEEVLNRCRGATIDALSNNLGIDNLWGISGEGINYYTNAMYILRLAEPFLRKKDKEGWIKFSQKYNEGVKK